MFFKLNQNRILFAFIRVVEDQVVQQLDRHHARVYIQRFHMQCYQGVQAAASLELKVVEGQVVLQLDRNHARVRIQRFHMQCYRGVQAVASLVQIVVEDQEE